jgi:hypothetical protein
MASDGLDYWWSVEGGEGPMDETVIRVRAAAKGRQTVHWNHSLPLGQEHISDITKVDLGPPLGRAVLVKLAVGAGSVKTLVIHAATNLSQINTIFTGVSKRGIRLSDVDFDSLNEVILIKGDLYGPVREIVYRYDSTTGRYRQVHAGAQARPGADEPEVQYNWRMEGAGEQAIGPGPVVRIEASLAGRRPLKWAYSISGSHEHMGRIELLNLGPPLGQAVHVELRAKSGRQKHILIHAKPETEMLYAIWQGVTQDDIRVVDIDSDGLREVIISDRDIDGSIAGTVYQYDKTEEVYVQTRRQ